MHTCIDLDCDGQKSEKIEVFEKRNSFNQRSVLDFGWGGFFYFLYFQLILKLKGRAVGMDVREKVCYRDD